MLVAQEFSPISDPKKRSGVNAGVNNRKCRKETVRIAALDKNIKTMPRRRSTYAMWMDAAERNTVRPAEVAAGIAERDERQATDLRTQAERALGDPPKWRSALAASLPMVRKPRKQPRNNPAMWKLLQNK